MTSPPPPSRHPPNRLDASNFVRIGIRQSLRDDLFHQLMIMAWPRLIGAIVVLYVALNAVFATLYLLGGRCIENAHPGSFRDMFFFSVQTMATIGYGKLTPITTYANILVTVESLTGILVTAMATGLMFAKFARPTSRVLFSRPAVIVQRDGMLSLMFRMANERGNQIVEAGLRVAFSRMETTHEGERVRRFYDLKLVRDHNVIFTLSWTAIHTIDASSPLHNVTVEHMRDQDIMIVASLVGIDETSGQTVHARHAYTIDDLQWDRRFTDIMSRTPDGKRVVDYRTFHDTQPNTHVS
jgi:inward rectifier potassium channel